VSDSEHCSLFEGLLHECLYLLLSDDVDVGGGLIQEHDLVLSEDSSSDADELLLSRAQTIGVSQFEVNAPTVAQIFVNVELRVVGVFFLRLTFKQILQASIFTDFQDLFIFNKACGVEVELNSTVEDDGVLRDHSDLRTQVVNVNLVGFDSVYCDRSRLDLKNTAEGEARSGLTTTRSSNNSNLVSRLTLEGESVKGEITVRSVTKVDVLKGDLSCLRPVCRDFDFIFSCAFHDLTFLVFLCAAENGLFLWDFFKSQ
jgi:hypothetical protein